MGSVQGWSQLLDTILNFGKRSENIICDSAISTIYFQSGKQILLIVYLPSDDAYSFGQGSWGLTGIDRAAQGEGMPHNSGEGSYCWEHFVYWNGF